MGGSRNKWGSEWEKNTWKEERGKGSIIAKLRGEIEDKIDEKLVSGGVYVEGWGDAKCRNAHLELVQL